MKRCRACNRQLDYSNFHKAHNFKDGYASRCKECLLSLTRTKQGIINTIYGAQRGNSKKRNYPLPDYTNKELSEWCFSQDKFHELYDTWVKSGYNRKLKPSCDRLNDYKPYTLDNIKLVSFQENEDKSHKDRKEGKNNKASYEVLQYDLEGNFINKYYSMQEAGRQTGIHHANIRAVAHYNAGLSKIVRLSAGGYNWKYSW